MDDFVWLDMIWVPLGFGRMFFCYEVVYTFM